MTPPGTSTASPIRPGDRATPPPDPLRAPPAPLPAAAGRPRRRLLGIAAAALAAAATAGWGIHSWLTRFDEGTDDAQVEADVVPLAPRVAGQVARVMVQDNQAVKQGDLLVVIDDADFAARARQAEAELETARAQESAAAAQVASAEAGLRRAGVDAGKAARDFERAEQLRAGDAIPSEKLDEARAAADSTRAGTAGAKAQYAAARAQARLAAARIRSAQAAADLAALQLSYTKIWAPADGVVSKLSVHEGQLVAAGQPMAELVPARTYVVANFKETQVGALRPGQKADVEIDAFPGRRLEGVVESLSGGTGARFSLIPPDNASGNFVKVVERVPVRIAWAKPPPADMALRAGLSAYVAVRARP